MYDLHVEAETRNKCHTHLRIHTEKKKKKKIREE